MKKLIENIIDENINKLLGKKTLKNFMKLEKLDWKHLS